MRLVQSCRLSAFVAFLLLVGFSLAAVETTASLIDEESPIHHVWRRSEDYQDTVEAKRIFVGIHRRPGYPLSLQEAKSQHDEFFFQYTILVSAYARDSAADVMDISNADKLSEGSHEIDNPIRPEASARDIKFQYKYNVSLIQSPTLTGRIEIGQGEYSTTHIRDMLRNLPTMWSSFPSCIGWMGGAIERLQSKGVVEAFDVNEFRQKILNHGFERQEALQVPDLSKEKLEEEQSMVFEYQKGALVQRRPRSQEFEAGYLAGRIRDLSDRMDKWMTSCRSASTADEALSLSVKIRSGASEISDLTARLADALDDHSELEIQLFESAWRANEKARVQSVEGDWQERISKLEDWKKEVSSYKAQLESNPRDFAAIDKISHRGSMALMLTSNGRKKTLDNQMAKIHRIQDEQKKARQAGQGSNSRLVWLKSREKRAAALRREEQVLQAELMIAQDPIARAEGINQQIQADAREAQEAAQGARDKADAAAITADVEKNAGTTAVAEVEGDSTLDTLITIAEVAFEILSYIPSPWTSAVLVCKWGRRAWMVYKAATRVRKTVKITGRAANTVKKFDKATSMLRSTLDHFEIKPKASKKQWGSFGDMLSKLDNAPFSLAKRPADSKVRSLDDVLEELDGVKVPEGLPALPSDLLRASSLDELAKRIDALPQHVLGGALADGASSTPQIAPMAKRQALGADKFIRAESGSSQETERNERLDRMVVKVERAVMPDENPEPSILDVIFRALVIA